jgi:hypothetical protein
MGIIMQKSDNLKKLLGGLALLDEQDQERIIRVVDTLEVADKKVKEDILYDVPLSTISNGSGVI